jgi:hypothetical protein
MADVRFGSKADIEAPPTDVRFTPKSRHWLSGLECLLCAKSRHSNPPVHGRNCSLDHGQEAAPSTDVSLLTTLWLLRGSARCALN